VALFRALVTTKLTVSHTFTVDEVPTDAAGDVTATVKRLDGTAVGAPAVATHPGAPGKYEFALPASLVLDAWSLDWTGTVAGTPVKVTDHIEHVGGFLFDLGQARSTFGSVQQPWNTSRYPPELLAAKRIATEQEAEAIAHRAFVPRFARFVLDGTGTTELVAPDMDLRTVRACKLADRAGATFVDMDAGSLAAVAAQPSGVLIRDDGGIWPAGHRNVIVEYEYGLDYPPGEVSDNAMLRMRYLATANRNTVPDRAISYTILEGGVYRMAQAGKRSTGSPDIDAAYLRNGNPTFWLAQR